MVSNCEYCFPNDVCYKCNPTSINQSDGFENYEDWVDAVFREIEDMKEEVLKEQAEKNSACSNLYNQEVTQNVYKLRGDCYGIS